MGRPQNPTHHRTRPVFVPRLLVNYVNMGPLERCGPGVHVSECGPSWLTWLTHITVGLDWSSMSVGSDMC